jgi:hypothetical protein
MSNRLEMWREFSEHMEEHIETYTVPQYGDYPEDQMTSFSTHDIVQNMKRYLNRSDSNQRGYKEGLLDCMKLAHYSCEMYRKKRMGFSSAKKEEVEDLQERMRSTVFID